MDNADLIDLIDSLVELARESRKIGHQTTAASATRLALNVALIELDDYRPVLRF